MPAHGKRKIGVPNWGEELEMIEIQRLGGAARAPDGREVWCKLSQRPCQTSFRSHAETWAHAGRRESDLIRNMELRWD